MPQQLAGLGPAPGAAAAHPVDGVEQAAKGGGLHERLAGIVDLEAVDAVLTPARPGPFEEVRLVGEEIQQDLLAPLVHVDGAQLAKGVDEVGPVTVLPEGMTGQLGGRRETGAPGQQPGAQPSRSSLEGGSSGSTRLSRAAASPNTAGRS